MQFLTPYPTDATFQNLVKIGPVVLEKKMLTDDGRQPIAMVTWVTQVNEKYILIHRKNFVAGPGS